MKIRDIFAATKASKTKVRLLLLSFHERSISKPLLIRKIGGKLSEQNSRVKCFKFLDVIFIQRSDDLFIRVVTRSNA